MPFVPFRRASPGRTGTEQDAALLQRVAIGDGAALERIYRAHAGPVYRYALALCNNPAWAADATQDAFVGLALRPEGFDPARGVLGGYLAGIARHALSARWRQAGHESPLEPTADAGADDGADGAEPGDHAASPEAILVQRQDGAAVWRALQALPAVFREALMLVDLQERPYAEAAQIAGIEINTLRTRVHRGRHKLAVALGGRDGGTP
jgi:RNA polymerase sigma-70 factor, ECF subfamily